MPRRRILSKKPGQALVEVVIATMIAAMTTMSVFSVVLSASVSQGKADKREAAALILKQAQETLKSYVSVDPLNSDLFPGVTPTKSGSPSGSSRGIGRWDYDNSNYWALAAGVTHDISSLIPSDSPLAGGTLRYTVADSDCLNLSGGCNSEYGNATGTVPGNHCCKRVVFTLYYPD